MRHFCDAYFDSKWSVKHHSTQERISIIDGMFGTEEQCFTTDYSAFESSISLMVEEYLAQLLEGHGVPHVVCEQIAYKELRVSDRAFKFRGRHIRRSGDYWTSFGNSVINCAITQAIADVVGMGMHF